MEKNLLVKSFALLKTHFLKKKQKTLAFLKALDFNEARLSKKTFRAFKEKDHGIQPYFQEKDGKIRAYIQEKDLEIGVFNEEKEDKIQAFTEENEIIKDFYNKKNAVFSKKNMFFEYISIKKKRLLKKILDFWGEITKKNWLFAEKNYMSLRLFQRKTLQKSFENMKKYFEIQEKKFLHRRNLLKTLEKSRKARFFYAFIEILRKKLIKTYKLLDFRFKILKKLEKSIFSIIKKNANFSLAFRIKKRQNQIKTIFISFQKSILMQKNLKKSILSFQISKNSRKTLKFFKILQRKTKENVLPRTQKKLAIISYKLTFYEAFFSQMKTLRKNAQKVRKFLTKRRKNQKIFYIKLLKFAIKSVIKVKKPALSKKKL